MSEYIQSVSPSRDFGIKREVMRRVYMVFFFRKVVKPFLVKMGSVAALALVATAFVSVQNVLGNMPSPAQFAAFGKFVLSAFLNTQLVVQAITLALAVLAVFAIRDLTRVSRLFIPRRIAV